MEGQAVNKHTSHRFHMEWFSLMKLNKVECKEVEELLFCSLICILSVTLGR
jgi:hypothetical protein